MHAMVLSDLSEAAAKGAQRALHSESHDPCQCAFDCTVIYPYPELNSGQRGRVQVKSYREYSVRTIMSIAYTPASPPPPPRCACSALAGGR